MGELRFQHTLELFAEPIKDDKGADFWRYVCKDDKKAILCFCIESPQSHFRSIALRFARYANLRISFVLQVMR